MTAPDPTIEATGVEEPTDANFCGLIGTLSSEPTDKVLPSGDVVTNYEVTCRLPGRPADSVPVSWFSPPKRRAALRQGDRVVVVGHVRRRFFRAGGTTASRTEVVAAKVAKVKKSAVDDLAMAMRLAADELTER